MSTTVEAAAQWVPNRSSGWLSRLFDNKAFLVALCLLPSAGLLIVFLTYPLGLGLWLSLTDATIGEPGQYIGLDNFISLAQDPVFWMSVTNTIMYTVVATVGKFLLGLWLAM
jgi:multiple sugar transport system permease protein